MLADNVVHFARVLRSAGIPVGPDRVLAALEAIEAVGLGRREDVHAALSAVMLDRHEQQALFDDAFAAFWRDPKLLERFMAELLPKISGRGERANKQRSHRLADALAARPRDERAAPGAARAGSRVRDQLRVLRPRAAAEGRLRIDDRGRVRARQEARRGSSAAVRAGAAAPPRGERARPDRPARDHAGDGAPAADARSALQPSAERAADDRRPARRLGIDGPLCAPHAALRARPDAALPQGAHADLRHAPHQHHAGAAPPRPRPRARAGERAGRGLEGRDADRVVPRRLQPALGAAAPRRERRAPARHRRSRPRRARRADARGRAAAAVRAPDRLAQPSAALRAFRAARRRRARAAAERRPLPSGPQPGEPRRPRRRPACGAARRGDRRIERWS